MFFPSAGVEINPLFLIGMGLAVGVCSGFFGFGGGFMLTPALNIFGFPMPYAIGTSITQTAGLGVMSTLRHGKLGHVDLRLGLLMVAGTMTGVEAGKRLVMYMEGLGNADMVIRWIYVAVLFTLGLYTFNEARKATAREVASLLGKKNSPVAPQEGFVSRIRSLNCPPFVSLPVSGISRISVCVPLGIGFATGILAGLLGAGGGFIRLPALIYVMGVPTVVAVGTDLFEVIISGSYGAFTYALANRVELLAVVLVLVGASAGVQVGAAATRYVSAERIRYYFALTILLTAVSVLLEQVAAIFGLGSLSAISCYLLLSVAGGMSMIIVILFLKSRSTALSPRRVEEIERRFIMSRQPK